MDLPGGSHVECTYVGKHLSGTVVQVRDGEVTIKLVSGYNVVLPVADLKDLKTTARERREPHATPPHQDPSLPAVTIIHTGGTIASKVDYATGAVIAQFDPAELLVMFPDVTRVANVTSRLLRNMQSDDMRFAHYNLMARAVLDEIGRDAHGVIITHGTDTLHYTAAALSFVLEGLSVPVVLVGSQRSSDRGSSDAASNLLGALRFITEARVPGVFVAMHDGPGDGSIAIIDGLRSRKNHTSRRDAFASVNAPLVARVVDGKVEIADAARVGRLRSGASDHPRVLPIREDLKVGIWYAHPQSHADELLVYDHYDGLVVAGTGLGHLPISEIDEFTAEHARIRDWIAKLARRIPVVMASQTIWGRVNMDVYSPGRALQELGVLGQGCDTHLETAFIKLAWLLSQHPDNARELYGTDLRGEVSIRSPLEDTHKGP